MKQRRIEFTPSFLRVSGKLLKKNPSLKEPFRELLTNLTVDPFTPSLNTHPLKGKLEGRYSCSLTYHLRVVFKLRNDSVVLIDIGSHDEIY